MNNLEELDFLYKLRETPNDEAVRLIYADWLDEHDQEEKATYLRTLVKVRNDFQELQQAKKRLDFDLDWLQNVSNGEEEYETYVVKNNLQLPPLTSILQMLENCGTIMTVNFDTLLGDSIKEKYEAFYVKLVEMTHVVLRKAIKEGEVWLCTSPEIGSIFETISNNFNPSKYFAPYDNFKGDRSPQYRGILKNQWKLYIHPLFPIDTILIGVGQGNLPVQNLGRIVFANFVI